VTTEFILLLLGAYLLGSVPMAYLVARWSRGIDIRQYGSGNVGASNVLSFTSRWWSIPVSIFDIGKGMVPVYLAQLWSLPVSQQVIIGLAAISGHNWPVFLRFNGGRGILTTLGVLLILTPWLTMAAAIFTLAWAPFRQLPLGALITLVLLPVFSWFLNVPFGIEKSIPLTLGFVAILLLALTRRLTASRTPMTALVSPGELLVNRLLFDRDIRDRLAWINQTPCSAAEAPAPKEKQGKS